jgi:RNA polymerase sigma-B factor
MRSRTATVAQVLDERSARLEARLTCPTERSGGRLRLGQAGTMPAMDPDLWHLHVRYRRSHLPTDRAALVDHYLPHAKRVAAQHFRRREDLEQVALEALVGALERFDHERSIPFLGFATPTISGSLKRYFRDAGWSVRVPRRVHELAPAARDAEAALQHELGRPPTDLELADRLDIEVRTLHEVRQAETARAADSTDRRWEDDASEVGGPDADLARVEDRLAVERAVARLAPDRRELLALYYDDGLTQDEIARRLGISQMQVSRLLRAALVQLRRRVQEG